MSSNIFIDLPEDKGINGLIGKSLRRTKLFLQCAFSDPVSPTHNSLLLKVSQIIQSKNYQFKNCYSLVYDKTSSRLYYNVMGQTFVYTTSLNKVPLLCIILVLIQTATLQLQYLGLYQSVCLSDCFDRQQTIDTGRLISNIFFLNFIFILNLMNKKKN